MKTVSTISGSAFYMKWKNETKNLAIRDETKRRERETQLRQQFIRLALIERGNGNESRVIEWSIWLVTSMSPPKRRYAAALPNVQDTSTLHLRIRIFVSSDSATRCTMERATDNWKRQPQSHDLKIRANACPRRRRRCQLEKKHYAHASGPIENRSFRDQAGNPTRKAVIAVPSEATVFVPLGALQDFRLWLREEGRNEMREWGENGLQQEGTVAYWWHVQNSVKFKCL